MGYNTKYASLLKVILQSNITANSIEVVEKELSSRRVSVRGLDG
jgi:hypothetical protein